jgi:hypothetical protein
VEHRARSKGVQTFLRLAVVSICMSAGPATADQPWTTADLDVVADVAMQSIAGNKYLMLPRVAELADALILAGNRARAKAILVQTMPSLDPSGGNGRLDFVEKLAQLGDAADAEALTAIDAKPELKVLLLGRLGVGRARTGDIAAAWKYAEAVTTLSRTAGATNVTLANNAQFSLERIGIALNNSGAPGEALRLAKGMQPGLHKLNVLAQIAYVLCAGATKRTNKDIADEAANTVRATPVKADIVGHRIRIAQSAAEVIAVCNGAEAAKTFTGELEQSDLTTQVLSKLADKLTTSNQIDLARAVAPAPDPDSVSALLDSANRLKKQGDRPAATRVALAASQLAVSIQRDPASLLGKLASTLAELGAYDAAIAVLQPMDIQNRQQYFVQVVRAEIQNKDGAAMARTLPLAIAAIREPASTGRPANLLYELTRTVAAGGYPNEAKVPYQSLLDVLASRPAKQYDQVEPWQFAILKADLGDLAGALADADKLGDRPPDPSLMQVMMLNAMQFAGAKTKPSDAEMLAGVKRSLEALRRVAGPKARALSGIAVGLAEQGTVDAALQVAARMDVDQEEPLQPRNHAFAAIAKAQEKAGDLRGSLSSIRQITKPEMQQDLLLKLAAHPAKS